jgi:hypothetical protein
MADRHPALAALDVLVGTWDTEGKHRLIDETIRGTATFEWLAGEQFLLQHSRADNPRIPEGLSIFGPAEAGNGLAVDYFDSRGVRRSYQLSLEHGVLRYWREASDFDQRFTATLGEETFVAEIEYAEAPGAWQHDMELIYRRRH